METWTPIGLIGLIQPCSVESWWLVQEVDLIYIFRKLPLLAISICTVVLSTSFPASASTGATDEDTGELEVRFIQSLLETNEVADMQLLLKYGKFQSAPASDNEPEAYFDHAIAHVNSGIGRLRPNSIRSTEIAPLSIYGSGCLFGQYVDNPHVSTGDVSTHGWWNDEGGICPTYANVDVYLQTYWCSSYGCAWVVTAYFSADVRARNIWNQRVTTRRTCTPFGRPIGWRGYVDVDLIGQNDPSGYDYSSPQNLYCTPG